MKKLFISIAVVFCFNVSTSFAEDRYFQVDYMLLDMQLEESGFSGDASPPAISLKLGTYFNQFLGVEVMGAFGIGDDDFITYRKGELKYLIGINAIGKVSAGDKVDIYGKFGFAQIEAEWKTEGDPTQSNVAYSSNDTGVQYGVGVAMNFSRYSAFALEYMVLPKVSAYGANVETSAINLGYRLAF